MQISADLAMMLTHLHLWYSHMVLLGIAFLAVCSHMLPVVVLDEIMSFSSGGHMYLVFVHLKIACSMRDHR